MFLGHRKTLLPALAATLLLQALGLLTPVISAVVMDRALPDHAASLLWTVVAGMALAALHQTWIGWVRDRILLCAATRIEASAEGGFFDHLLHCPFPFLQGRTPGDFSQAFSGFQAARAMLPLKTLGTAMNGGMAIASLVLMFHYLPLPAGFVLLTTLAQALATWLVGRVEAKLEVRQVAAQVREQGLLIELVSGIGTLKAAGAEAKGLDRWRRRYAAVLALARTQSRIQLWFSLGMGAVGQATGIVLLVWGGYGLLEGRLSIGRLFAFLQLAGGFNGAVQSMVGLALGLMVLLRPQLAKAQEILAVAPEPAAKAEPPSPDPVAVLVEDVWFRYSPAHPWILQGYQLRLEPGEKHTLDAPSGAGKTTILRLLAGLHVPERGSIRIAGRKPKEARHVFAYLPQFAQIFGGSVDGQPEAVLPRGTPGADPGSEPGNRPADPGGYPADGLPDPAAAGRRHPFRRPAATDRRDRGGGLRSAIDAAGRTPGQPGSGARGAPAQAVVRPDLDRAGGLALRRLAYRSSGLNRPARTWKAPEFTPGLAWYVQGSELALAHLGQRVAAAGRGSKRLVHPVLGSRDAFLDGLRAEQVRVVPDDGLGLGVLGGPLYLCLPGSDLRLMCVQTGVARPR